jgi:TPR repeat protein
MTFLRWGTLGFVVSGAALLTVWFVSEPSHTPHGGELSDKQIENPSTATKESGEADSGSSRRAAPPLEQEPTDSTENIAPSSVSSPLAEDLILARFLERGCIDRSQTRVAQLSPIRRAELRDWLESEGSFGDVNLGSNRELAAFDDYASYDRDALEQLAADHQDPKAQLTLGTRLLDERDYSEARRWFREAAINGYSAPIGRIGFLRTMERMQEYRDQMEVMNEDEHRQVARQALLEYIAYVEFAAMRGAPLAGPTLRMMKDREIFGGSNSLQADFSESELTAARQRGHDLYQEFEEERLERGLPPFDNNRPAIAELIDADMNSRLSARKEGLRPCD